MTTRQSSITAALGKGSHKIDEARDAYRRAIKPMAPDRRPIDALRDLRSTK
jgi:hypothetical protein